MSELTLFPRLKGLCIFVVLTLLFLVIMCSSIYVGFWINLHDEGGETLKNIQNCYLNLLSQR